MLQEMQGEVMAILVKLKDGAPGLLFLRPETHVVRLTGVDYRTAFERLRGRVTLADRDGELWSHVVEKFDGSTNIPMVEL